MSRPYGSFGPAPELDPFLDDQVPPSAPPGANGAPDPETQPPRVHLRDRLLTVSGLATLEPTTPLIDGLLYRDTLAQLSAAPGQYKTFATLGMACALAVSSNWEGHRIPENIKVVYVAAEGANGVRVRVLAWCEMTGRDPAELDGKLFILPCPIQLGYTVDVTEAIELVQEIDAGLLVLDTRARCTIGLEENSATEQGKAIHQAERIQAAAECTVLGVHHSSRGGSAGRGSNAWDGAVWTDLRMEGADLAATINCFKHKDVPSGCDHHYRLVQHTVSAELMPDVDEDQRKTLVLVQNDPGLSPPKSSTHLDLILDLVWTTAPREGLTTTDLMSMPETKNISKSSLYGALKTLVKDGKAQNVGTERRSRYVPLGRY